MSAFDDMCEYARELGIPEDKVEDVASLVGNGQSPYGEGCDAENTKEIIEAAAREFENPVTFEDGSKGIVDRGIITEIVEPNCRCGHASSKHQMVRHADDTFPKEQCMTYDCICACFETIKPVEPYAQRGGKVTPGEFAILLFGVLVLLAAWGGSQ